MKLKISDVRKRMDGRDALVRVRNRLETAQGEELDELVQGLEALAGPPALPPNADALTIVAPPAQTAAA